MSTMTSSLVNDMEELQVRDEMSPTEADKLNDEEWEEAEGLPSMEDEFIQRYFAGRDALVAQERRQRSDHAFRQTLSPMAAEASAIVSQIRFAEMNTVWTRDYEDKLAEDEGDFFPGMMFTRARKRMEQTKLWKILRRMPKGALLHCHMEAMVDLDWLFEEAFKTEGMCIAASSGLSTPAELESAPFHFIYKKNSAAPSVSIWSESYQPETPISIHRAADSFLNGGREGFIEWLHSRCSITKEESIQHHLGPNAIWRKFQSTFPIIGSLVYYEPIFRQFIPRMCQQLLEDGVRYADIRAAFTFQYGKTGSEAPEDTYEEMLRVLGEEIDDFKASEAGERFWGARMIWTTLRKFSRRQIVESMKQCIAMKQQFPHLIAGFDLVGWEDLGRPLADLTPELFWFKKACLQAGVDIPFFFHAGETLGEGDEVDENLFDAILLGTRRIGHGFSLYKHPLLIDMVKEKRILIESCPISNEMLRLTGSINSHPLPALLARGVPVSLCNDDPAVFGQESVGLTHNFWQALQGWESLGLEGLGSLAENSIRWAAFEDLGAKEWGEGVKMGAFGKGLRAERMKEWAAEWEKFCQWVVLEFGVDEDYEGELEALD